MDCLDSVIRRLCNVGFYGELWVDGSFLTVKNDPEDVDLLLFVPMDFYQFGTPAQKDAIDWFESGLKYQYLCDSYVTMQYPPGHLLGQRRNRQKRSEWMDRYGRSVKTKDPKGIIGIFLPAGLYVPCGLS